MRIAWKNDLLADIIKSFHICLKSKKGGSFHPRLRVFIVLCHLLVGFDQLGYIAALTCHLYAIDAGRKAGGRY